MILNRRIPTPVVVLAVIGLAGGAGYLLFRGASKGGQLDVHYPYWCAGCKKVFDVEVLRKDYPKNWRIARGGPSDSVVVCPFCNKGWAYPVATCHKCGARYVLHLAGDGRCPVCHPANAKAARAKGVDLMPPELTGR